VGRWRQAEREKGRGGGSEEPESWEARAARGSEGWGGEPERRGEAAAPSGEQARRRRRRRGGERERAG